MHGDQDAVFTPTDAELAAIVRHWVNYDLGVRSEFVFAGMSIDDEHRRAALGLQRVAGIASVLGEEEVRRIVEEVRDDFATRLGPEPWELFELGMPDVLI